MSKNEPAILSRDQFLKAKTATSRRSTVVNIPGLGSVKIRSLKERERAIYEQGFLDGDGDLCVEGQLSAKRRLIVLCVVDNDLNPILTDGDLDALADMDGNIITELAKEISEFLGFKKNAVGDLMGNSNATGGD